MSHEEPAPANQPTRPRGTGPVEQRGRAPLPPYMRAAPQATPQQRAYDVVARQGGGPVRPVADEARERREAEGAIRAQLGETRERFASALQASQLKSDIAQRIEKRRKRYAELSQQSAAPMPANEAQEVRVRSEGGERREGFTSPGLVLKQQASLLTENRFAPTGVLPEEQTREFKEGYEKWHARKREREERRERIAASSNDPIRTNNYGAAFGAAASEPGARRAPPPSLGDHITNPHELDRLTKPRVTQQLVDSRQRDATKWRDANNFVISLSRRFNDVKKVRLLSTEIPNTDLVIRDDPRSALLTRNRLLLRCGDVLNDANKHVYWINDEDATEAGIYDCLVYDACITPGNYEVTDCACDKRTLQTEIEEAVAAVNRFSDGTAHQFLVTIDEQTNVVSIASVASDTLPVDPFATAAGTNIVTVTQLQHPFVAGDRVTFTGAEAVDGIAASTLNAEHEVLEVVDGNTYRIRVATVASSTASGGGANVLAGQGRPFMLLASNVDSPFSAVLGFPQQDSAEQLATPIEFIERDPPDLAVDPDAPTEPGALPARICANNHCLVVGDEVLVLDTSTVPDINGLQTVTRVISEDKFEIGLPVKVVNNQVTTTQLVLGSVKRSLSDALTEITELTAAQTGWLCVECPHGLGAGDLVWIGNVCGGLTGALEDLNGIQTVSANVAADKFRIADGVLYAGYNELANAFVVATTTDSLQAITGIVPANNGRFCPDAGTPVFAGAQVPQYVLLQDTQTVPDVNGDVSVLLDAVIGNCDAVEVKSGGAEAWQSFLAPTDAELVGLYARVGGSEPGSEAVAVLFEGEGTGGTQLAVSDPARVDRDACAGAFFCFPSPALQAGQLYTWAVRPITAADQMLVLCLGAYAGGRCDVDAGSDYQFRAYASPGVQQVSYYSETSGKFDLVTPVCEVLQQSPNQSFVRVLDAELRCIKDATVASVGALCFDEAHGCQVGDFVYVARRDFPNASSEPEVRPNLVGRRTVTQVLDAKCLATDVTVAASAYAAGQLELVKMATPDVYPIAGVYPKSTGYFCRAEACEAPCELCPGDAVLLRGGEGNVAPAYQTDLWEQTRGLFAPTLHRRVYGCYRVSQVFAGTSCGTLFDVETQPGQVIGPETYNSSPDPLINFGEVVKLDTSGSTAGLNGTFAQAAVYFEPELCGNVPSEYADGLCLETLQPHLLGAGDPVYLLDPTVDAACAVAAGNVMLTPLAQLHNLVARAVPVDATRFKLYDVGLVSGTGTTPTACQQPPAGTVVDEGRIAYHRLCGPGAFTPITSFLRNSYDGAIESPDHQLDRFFRAQIYVAGLELQYPWVGGCTTYTRINDDFLTTQTIEDGVSLVDPELWGTAEYVWSGTGNIRTLTDSIEVQLEQTDTFVEIGTKTRNAILAYAAAPYEPANPAFAPMVKPIASVGISYQTEQTVLTVTAHAAGLPGTHYRALPDAEVGTSRFEQFRIDTQGAPGTAEVVHMAIPSNLSARSYFFGEEDGVPVANGAEAPYFVLWFQSGVAAGPADQGTTYYKVYVWYSVTAKVCDADRSGSGVFVLQPDQSAIANAVETCAPLPIAAVEASSNGMIYAPNDFQGGECLYFLNDVTLNAGTGSALAGTIATVSSTGLSSTAFQLDATISSIGSVFGNAVAACETLVFQQAGVYEVPATVGQYEVILGGAGGGNGYDHDGAGTPGSGGAGGLVRGVITVTQGVTLMRITVGGAGLTGSPTSDHVPTPGGFNGGGAARGYNNGPGVMPHGQGSGGGATELRVSGTASAIAIAAGGGGGTAFFPATLVSGVTRQQTGYDGGEGGGLTGQDGGASDASAAGKGGGPAAGGAGGIGPGTCGSVGSGTATFGPNIGFGGGPSADVAVSNTGGGAGRYGGGAGLCVALETAGCSPVPPPLYEGAGGGGASLVPSGWTTVTGGGAPAATDGFAVLRPLRRAVFATSEGTYGFTVPSTATSVTFTLQGGNGGNASSGGVGGVGGYVQARFFVGGDSRLQPNDTLVVTVGRAGDPGSLPFLFGTQTAAGGFGGGGHGGTATGADPSAGGGGGGASDIRLSPGGLEDRVLVAGGGGGGGGFVGGSAVPLNGGAGGGGDAPGRAQSGGGAAAGGVGDEPGTLATGGDAESVAGTGGATYGGGGGGYYGGGAGTSWTVGTTEFGGRGGGGGSSYVLADQLTVDQGSVVMIAGGGTPGFGVGRVVIEWEVEESVRLPMGHFVRVPCADECDPCGAQFVGLQLIERKTNGVFCSASEHGLPIGNLAAGEGECLLLTDGVYCDEDVGPLQDVIARAVAYQTPPPAFSLTKFETEIVVQPEDLESGGFPLFGNHVDEVSTDDLRYPGIRGLGWVRATDCKKNPLLAIQRDSNGTLGPVKPGLEVGDHVYLESIHPTVPDLTGVHTVSYVDVGNAVPQFFELADVELIDVDGPVAPGNIWCFETVANARCLAINEITANACPTELRVTDHGYTVGTTVNLFVMDAQTDPSINSVEGNVLVRDIIKDVEVVDTDLLRLPLVDCAGNSLCYIDVLNDTNVLVEPRGRFSRQILSTNCGEALYELDVGNGRTLVHTASRAGLRRNVAFPIIQSVPAPPGVTTVVLDMPPGESLVGLWAAGTHVVVSGHVLGSPWIDGEYEIFNVLGDRFDVAAPTDFASTGGTGGYATGPGPATVPGHGLRDGDLVRFSGQATRPPIEGTSYPATVIDGNTFSVPFEVQELVCSRGTWCTNWVDMELKDHGLVDGDVFFLYGAQPVGGLVGSDLNTVHGEKRRNVPTQQELATRKVVRVVDGNNLQFLANYDAFPTARGVGGGYELCISARNHTNAEKAAGLKNYGFAATQTNQSCLGDSQRFLDLNNEAYVLLTSERLTTDDVNPILNTGQVDGVFAKIQLSVEPGETAFNTFVGGERVFYEPIARMDSIDVQLYRPDGKLFDLRGREVSFTLEIEEFQDRLRTANVSSRRGINDPGAIGSIGLVESAISRENPTQNLAGALDPSRFVAATSLTQRAQTQS